MVTLNQAFRQKLCSYVCSFLFWWIYLTSLTSLILSSERRMFIITCRCWGKSPVEEDGGLFGISDYKSTSSGRFCTETIFKNSRPCLCSFYIHHCSVCQAVQDNKTGCRDGRTARQRNSLEWWIYYEQCHNQETRQTVRRWMWLNSCKDGTEILTLVFVCLSVQLAKCLTINWSDFNLTFRK